jgi:hypothetical protein
MEENVMTVFKSVLFAAVAAFVAGQALAQQRGVGADPQTDPRAAPPEHSVMFYNANGTTKMMYASTAGHDEIMKHARALSEGAAIYRSGGKFYLIENKKMANGTMLFDQMGPWNLADRQAVGQQ